MWLNRFAIPAFAARFALAKAMEAVGMGATKHVPLSLDDLSADWFEAKIGEGAALEALDVTGGSSGTTERRGFAFEWAGKSNRPAQVFCKMSSSLGTRLTGGISGAMRNEAWFYNKVRPHLALEAPVGYYAACDDFSGRSIQVIEDVAATKGARFLNALTPISREMAEDQMRVLARLHGQGKKLAQSIGTPQSYVQFMTTSYQRAMIKPMHFRGLAKAGDALPAGLRNRHEDTWEASTQSIALHNSLPQTLVHCDVHPGNWYQCDDERMGLLDWQCLVTGHWSRDLAYCLSAGLTIENRRAWERDLVALYLDQLASEGGDAVPFNDGFTLYRSQLPSALSYWTPTYAPPPLFPAMQPEDVAHEVVIRTATAMDDLDSFGALTALS